MQYQESKTAFEIISELGLSKQISPQSRKQQRADCPKCTGGQKKTLGVRVVDDGVVYHCYRCKFSGKEFFEQTNPNQKKRPSVEAFQKPIEAKPTQLIPEHVEYLKSRKLLTGDRLNVKTSHINGFNRIVFDYGQDMAKSFAPGQGWQTHKPEGKTMPLWGANWSNPPAAIVITEGEWDALAAETAGVDWAVTSLPNGGAPANTENARENGKLACIRDNWRVLKSVKKVVLAMDNDKVGRATQEAIIELFGRWRCAVVEYPAHKDAEGDDGRCKDLNEVLIKFGPEKVRSIVNCAKSLKLLGAYEPKDIPRPPKREYYNLGIYNDKHEDLFNLYRGGLSVVSGITNHGKTNFLFWMCAQLIEKYDLKIGLATFEDEFHDDIIPWFGDYLYGEDKPKNWYNLTWEWMQEHFRIISYQIEPLGKTPSIEWYLEQCEASKLRWGCDLFILDPWNKISHAHQRGESETDYIGRALAMIKNFAMANSVVMVVTCHPTKETHAGGSVSLPNITQLHGSMNWGNGSDHVVIVFREDLEGTETCISVQKVKHQTNQYREGAGKCGISWMNFENNRYERIPPHNWPEL